jgi:hypothetical protein
MFTVPSKSQIFWGVILALAVVVAVSRFSFLSKLATGHALDSKGNAIPNT